jgi:hypothetical protein
MTLLNQPKDLLDHEYAGVIHSRGLAGFTRTQVEALVRFAAEFLCRAKHNLATPEGLEDAYLRTIPVEHGYEEVHAYMQDLGELVRNAFHENFRTWVGHEVPNDHRIREIADVRSALARLNPVENTEQYNLLFNDLVALEQERRHTAVSKQKAGDRAAG